MPAQAANTYILLAVGDALVAQIPALLISVAAAMVVSRVGKEHDIGSQIGKQLFSSAKALGVVAGIVGVLGLIPGMPHMVFLVVAAAIGWARVQDAPPRAGRDAAQRRPRRKRAERQPRSELGRPDAGRHARAWKSATA